ASLQGARGQTFPLGCVKMNIRPFASGDRERIREILVATARFTRQEVGWAMELVDLVAAGKRGEYEAHVIEDAVKNVQGYVLFGPTPMAEGVFDLYWIAVDPRQQGQGLGQILLRFVENEVRRQDGRMLLIETSSKRSYAPTVRFYQRAGYRETSRIKDFYRIEDDKVVFSKTLT
ncbi:MAG TPA: N-acetyltransferase, partial [Thermoanaerobaculia bacterium]|nr:N-acetyltransferase [Thermoanaerobaculia bacterium]